MTRAGALPGALCWMLLSCCLAQTPHSAGSHPAPSHPAPSHPASSRPRVTTGAELLLGDSIHLVAGKRIALLCNHTAILPDGTHLLTALRARPELTLQAVFVPEHGLDGSLPAGEIVSGSSWEGIPVYSLYGASRSPTAAMLRGIDVLLVDIQDIGVRYYTYLSTLVLVMEAAGAAGIPVLILDRPNPLGGELVEGPLLRPSMRSFIGMLPVPVRHGMTLGELARMAVGEGWIAHAESLSCAVLPMRGWRRAMYYRDTGLPWRNPSPNITCDTAALLYAGVCLLEGTNLSEGRGTGAPFLQAGAPFLDARRFTKAVLSFRVPGIALRPQSFVPRSVSAAPHPKLEGLRCNGARFIVTDRNAFRPLAFGAALLLAARETASDSFRLLPHLDRLLGVPGGGRLLGSRATAERALHAWERESASFAMKRKPYLLY